MRIEPNRAQAQNALTPLSSSALSDRAQFQEALQSLLSRSTEPSQPHYVLLKLKIESPVLAALHHLNPQQLEKRLITVEIKEEISEDIEELEELREDEYLEDLEENHDNMERLVDSWEEKGREVKEGKDLEKTEAKEDLTDPIDGDESVDPEFELVDSDTSSDKKGQHDELLRTKKLGNQAEEEIEKKENELDYQEIQLLVETVLNANKQIHPKTRSILQQLLSSLMNGERWLLDQHRLLSLDKKEWNEINKMFPRHFYGGLLHTSYALHHQLPVYEMLEASFMQVRPNKEEQEAWVELLSKALGKLPLFIANWLRGESLNLAETDTTQLADWLEIWKTHNALPPGAAGRTLQLALDYRHHPESMQQLVQLAQNYFYARPLNQSQLNLAAKGISTRCFPEGLLGAHIDEILVQALRGESLAEDKLMLLLQGCSQSVLAYLPCGYLHADLQAIVEYIHRDLLGLEEQVPGMLKEASFGIPV